MAKVWRVLSIDGGGIRGIIPATVLAHIEERTKKPIADMFDLIAGTSTGGILTLGLTTPDKLGRPQFTAQQLCELYRREIPVIFHGPQSWWGNLLSPKYNASALRHVLEKSVGDCRLKSALVDVLIPCYDIEHRSPHIFKSRWAKWQSQYDFLMKDVAMATSATPTLFEPVRIARPDAGGSLFLVDGGVFANNPTMYAMSELNSMSVSDDDEYFVLSLGTGESTRQLTNDFVSLWGYVQWSRPMLELVMESNSESVHEQMKYMLPPTDRQHYYRIQVDLPEHPDCTIDMATDRNMQALVAAIEAFFGDSQYQQDLTDICDVLVGLSEQKAESGLLSGPHIFSHHHTHEVAVCSAEQDREEVAYPFAEFLRSRGVTPVVDRFTLQPDTNMRRLILKATETAAISVVILSPALLRNAMASKQMKWLYARTLSGNNMIVPILHGISKEDVSGFVKKLGWDKTAITSLKFFVEFSIGSTTDGIEFLAGKLVERMQVGQSRPGKVLVR